MATMPIQNPIDSPPPSLARLVAGSLLGWTATPLPACGGARVSSGSGGVSLTEALALLVGFAVLLALTLGDGPPTERREKVSALPFCTCTRPAACPAVF